MNSPENKPGNGPVVLGYGKEPPFSEKLLKWYQVHRRLRALPRAEILAGVLTIPALMVPGALIFLVWGDLRWWGTLPSLLVSVLATHVLVHWLSPADWKRIKGPEETR